MLGFVLRVSGLVSVDLSECSMGDAEVAGLVAGFLHFDVMPHPPPAPGPRHTPPQTPSPCRSLVHGEGQREEEGEEHMHSFDEEKDVVEEFCAATVEWFVARQVAAAGTVPSRGRQPCEGYPTSCGAQGCAQGCRCGPLLQDLNLSYNRFKFPGVLVPLLVGPHVGLGCLTLMGNR